MNLLPSRKVLSSIALVTATALSANAQNETDALRFSTLQPQGTARSIGFGSALGSVGGDFSTLAVNPAGIGIYRSSEITFTPSLTFSNTSSDFTGNSAQENGSHFAISNLGLITTKVFNGRRAKRTGWTTVSFGLGMTRLADYTRDYSYQGRNTTSSGSFIFEADANNNGLTSSGQPISQGDLGYDTYLINQATSGSGYLSVVNPTAASPINQSTIVHERGGMSELGLTLGGSYENKLMLGATVGIPIIRYIRTKNYEERDLSGNDNNNFGFFQYTDDLKTTGAGVNLKLGAIYKFSDFVRMGVAIHTPSYLSLHDVDNRSLTTNTENFHGTVLATAAENQYDYNLLTPYRAVVSGTVLFGKYGFFSVDYEYVDYSSSRFTFGGSSDEKAYQSLINNNIQSTFQGASNIRTGIELRLDNIFLRGGFGYYGNPYKSGNPSAERLDFSGGIGFRFERSFIDLGFVHHQYKTSEQPYTLPDTNNPSSLYYNLVVPTAQLTTGANNAVLTVGFKF
ncbi:MAG: hypothetical protein ABI378_11655 [Chitinophagaceae bacterium]